MKTKNYFENSFIENMNYVFYSIENNSISNIYSNNDRENRIESVQLFLNDRLQERKLTIKDLHASLIIKIASQEICKIEDDAIIRERLSWNETQAPIHLAIGVDLNAKKSTILLVEIIDRESSIFFVNFLKSLALDMFDGRQAKRNEIILRSFSREEVFCWVALSDGKSVSEISVLMNLSDIAVTYYVKKVLNLLKADTIVQAVAIFYNNYTRYQTDQAYDGQIITMPTC